MESMESKPNKFSGRNVSESFLRISFIFFWLIFLSCSSGEKDQPVTEESMEIKKFSEPLTTPAFSTKYVIEDKKDITLVRHESEDGAWMFFSDDKYENFEEVAKVVGLGEVIKIDSTVLQIADMPKGYYAIRDSKLDNWKIEKLKEK